MENNTVWFLVGATEWAVEHMVRHGYQARYQGVWDGEYRAVVSLLPDQIEAFRRRYLRKPTCIAIAERGMS